MKRLDRWSFRSLGGKIMAGLALAAILGSIEAPPASAGDRDRYEERGRHDNGRFEKRGHGHDHDRDHRRYYDRREYRTTTYVEPVYVPPPVYYAPEVSPGISIFLPTIHIR
jgi:hypothetical protein